MHEDDLVIPRAEAEQHEADAQQRRAGQHRRLPPHDVGQVAPEQVRRQLRERERGREQAHVEPDLVVRDARERLHHLGQVRRDRVQRRLLREREERQQRQLPHGQRRRAPRVGVGGTAAVFGIV